MNIVKWMRDRKLAAIRSWLAERGLTISQTEGSEWKKRLIDALVVDHILVAEHEDDPQKCIDDLISYNMQIALDRRVSKEAEVLFQEGRQYGLEEAMKILEE